MSELPKITQAQFERFLGLLEERGIEPGKMNVASYAGGVVRCAVEAGWFDLEVDQADPRDVILTSRAIQKRVQEILAPDPN